MVEKVNYIFGSIRISPDIVKNIRNTFRHQARLNRILTAFAFTIATYALLCHQLMVVIHNHKRDKKIEKLIKEIEGLKRMKGE